ncbi:MAG: exodeoxyribonuclease V subunit gamma, partial [Leptothrix sp. (in: b-proteobacteria)]
MSAQPPPSARHPITPGLLILHGNRLERLCDAVFAWLRRAPLAPLEEEVFLVQSNGVAEWLKMTLAAQAGICAATRVELPGRFLWRAYRQVLGREAVPAQSPLDKLPLTWRLMALLPTLLDRPGFEPLAGFLGDDQASGALDRRLQLAERLADLYDQYQVYRSDWLGAWADGDDRLARLDGERSAT